MEESTPAKRLGKWFATSREQAGLTQEQVSAQVGCLITDLSRYENGHKFPTLLRALTLCQALGKQPNEMSAVLLGK